MNDRTLAELSQAERRPLLVRSFARCLASVVLIVAGYGLVPFDAHPDGLVLLRSAAVVITLLVVVVLGLRSISRAQYPALRAVEAFSVAIPLTVVAFASVYLSLSLHDSAAFSEELNHVGAMYLSMTTITTVGFGDISALSDAARLTVMAQMIVDAAVVVIAARVAIHSVRKRLDTRPDIPATANSG